MAAAMCAGTSGRTLATDRASVVMTRDITDCGVGPACGASPASISKSSVPSA